MPEMNGKELSLKILEFCPNAKCLFMSGYPIDLVSYHGILEKGVNFIEKPFNSQDLVAKVESILFQNTKMNNENLS
jgi:FixJ family two-component response regulator